MTRVPEEDSGKMTAREFYEHYDFHSVSYVGDRLRRMRPHSHGRRADNPLPFSPDEKRAGVEVEREEEA